MAGAVFIAAAANRRREEDAAAMARCEEMWKPVAERTGLTFSMEQGRPMLWGKPKGILCSISVELDRYGHAHTRATATPLKSVDCFVGVYPNPNGALGYLKTLFAQDIIVGDPPFDEAFLIQGKPDALVPSLLSVTIRDQLASIASYRLTAFTYEPGNVMVQLPNVELGAEWLEAALEVVLEGARWSPESTEPFR